MTRRCVTCGNINPCREHSTREQDAEIDRNLTAIARLRSPAIAGGEMVLREAAQFLCDRLDDLEWLEDSLDDTLRDYMGHVDPAHHRLKGALANISDTEQPRGGRNHALDYRMAQQRKIKPDPPASIDSEPSTAVQSPDAALHETGDALKVPEGPPRSEGAGLRKVLEKIGRIKYGLQGIQEDYGHDTNAYNYHALRYYQRLARGYELAARNALATPPPEMEVSPDAAVLEARIAELEAALRPFADAAVCGVRPDDSDTMRPAINTAADYRRARSIPSTSAQEGGK